MAGQVQEVVTGQSWEDDLKDILFNPLGRQT